MIISRGSYAKPALGSFDELNVIASILYVQTKSSMAKISNVDIEDVVSCSGPFWKLISSFFYNKI